MPTPHRSARSRVAPRINRDALIWLIAGYPLFYTLGYLSKSIAGSAAIWPSHALTFAAFMLLPLRLWPPVILGTVAWDLASRPVLFWFTTQSETTWALSLAFACANVLTSLGPAAVARGLRLFRVGEPFPLVISPLWILAMFAGSLPGSLIGAAASAEAAEIAVAPAGVGLWLLSSVLTVVTYGPMVFGLLLGFHEPTPRPARRWEGWAVSLMVVSLFACFAFVPEKSGDPLVQPMLFAVPLSWLALRFSRRVTSFVVAIVATGVVFFAGYGIGIYQGFSNAAGWRDVIISIDIFLVIACGGALLINLLNLRQRALLDELEREHAALRDYARALGVAEDTARRKTAADLHDGIGQVLAGQSMTLAAMRAHAGDPPLAAMLDEAVEASREAQEGLRVMIQDLSPPGLDQASLEDMLAWLADFFDTRHGFHVNWRVTGRAQPPRERSRLIYRCIRELLMNARKHSQQLSAEVEVDVSHAGVEINVVDEGIGFDACSRGWRSGRGFGLTQLEERILAAGGTLDLDAVAGEGCRATVRLPAVPQNLYANDAPITRGRSGVSSTMN
jgi:signal transduction histidine kinase